MSSIPYAHTQSMADASHSSGVWRGDLAGHRPSRSKGDLVSGVTTTLATVKRNFFGLLPSSSRPGLMPSSTPLTNKPTGTASPVTFIFLCGLWYASSALSSNTGKAILTQFRYPITLTIVQFGFVAGYCLLFMSLPGRFAKLRTPTKAIIRTTLPMGMFQVGGHMFSSIAMSRIPVSTVHTIKALSPLFTVAAYALLFGVSYSSQTYISLLPLTMGVMLACSFDMSASNFIGLLCAFGSALVFVSSNIFFKKVMPSNGAHSQSSSHKLDKLNLLLYSSGMAFVLMIPIWLFYDLSPLLSQAEDPDHITHPKHEARHSVAYFFFMNGTVHFGQNIIAFVILGSTSPVTYSIASLIKRVVVIVIAIIWFSQSVHPIQAFGIILTFTGLYMYNNAKADVDRGEKKMHRVEAARELMLPVTQGDSKLMSGSGEMTQPPQATTGETTGTGYSRLPARGRTASISHSQHPPPLSLKMPQANPLGGVSSPTNSYPSPPPSLDSPTSGTVPLDHVGISMSQPPSTQYTDNIATLRQPASISVAS